MTDYRFEPPTVDEGPIGVEYLFNFFKMKRGISIVKSDGIYYQVRTLDYDLVPTYEECYNGGTVHTVTSAVRTAMLASDAGITVDNFTAI